jgi:hypothetical protein
MPDHDIFISYAHADDEVPVGAAKGWVTTLIEELNKVLRRKLGGAGARVWMDHQLAANQNVTDTLLSTLRDSRTLLLVMSPGYQASVWCQRELGRFLEAHAASKNKDNVFAIELEPVERTTWHPALQPLTPIRFWRQGFGDIAPRLLGFPMPKPDEDNPYWRNVNELAHLIAQQLKNPPSAPELPRRTVWLAETTEDLLGEREAVAGALRQQGFEVVPAAPYPRESEAAYLERLRGDLACATLLVQLLGPREGYRPSGGQQSFVALQASEAQAVAGTRGVRWVQWRARETDPTQPASAAYRDLLAGLSVQASGIEEFKLEVLKALAPPAAPPPAPAGQRPAVSAGRNGELYVYVNADPVDRDLAFRVQDSLVALGVDTALAPEPSPEQIRLAQQEQLQICDGVVLVYGQAPASWVQSQFAFTRRTLAQRRRGLWGALLDGPLPEKPEAGVRSPSLLTLNCRTGLEPSALSGFIQALRGAAVHV